MCSRALDSCSFTETGNKNRHVEERNSSDLSALLYRLLLERARQNNGSLATIKKKGYY